MNNVANREERIKILRDKFKYMGLVEFNEKNQLVIPGDISFAGTNLTSLEGAPDIVTGNFYCTCTTLTSLEGAPKEVGGNFYCGQNKLKSLAGVPKIVGGGFDCNMNRLTSLIGSPIIVGGGFGCPFNNLTSLSGVPKKIDGVFSISVFPNTPLLKILDVVGIIRFKFYKKDTYDHIHTLEDLFQENYGTKNAIMKVGLEMIRIGYGSNAKL